MRYLLTFPLVLLLTAPAHAFNALGHKVIADIAWQQLDPAAQQHIVAILRRHPRFDEDFAQEMPADVEDEGRWIFQQASTWPDMARGLRGEDQQKFNHPRWHYVNIPIILGPERPLSINRSMDYSTELDASQWNIARALKRSLVVVNSDAPPSDKALAYCWSLHLVGDIHQPLHSSALFCDRFPEGDRGGNSIPTVQGGNLHSQWDGLLGRRARPNDVKREVAELKAQPEAWEVDADGSIETSWRRSSSTRRRSLRRWKPRANWSGSTYQKSTLSGRGRLLGSGWCRRGYGVALP